MLDILFFSYYLNFFSIKIPLLDHRPPLTSATSEEAQVFFSQNTFLKSECSNKKYEVCHNFLIEIFTKSLLTGGVPPVNLYLKFEYAVHIY